MIRNTENDIEIVLPKEHMTDILHPVRIGGCDGFIIKKKKLKLDKEKFYRIVVWEVGDKWQEMI